MQKRALETKNKILTTAQQLFAQFGPNGVTVDTIADKAGVNKQRIYAYYKSKSKLFEAVLVDAFTQITEKDQTLLKLTETDIEEMTRIILEHYFNIHKNNPIFWRLIAYANLEDSIDLNILHNIKAKSFIHLKNLYQQGQKNAIFNPEVSFEVYMFNLTAVSYVYFSNRKTLSQTLDTPLFAGTDSIDNMITETITLLK